MIRLLLYMPFHKRPGLYGAESEVLPSTLYAGGHILVLWALLRAAALTGPCAWSQANHAFRLWGRRNGAEAGAPTPGGGPEEPELGSKGRAAAEESHSGNGSGALDGTEDVGEATIMGHGCIAAI